MKLLNDISIVVVKHSISPLMYSFAICCFLLMGLNYPVFPESFKYYLFFTFVDQLAIAMLLVIFELSEIFDFFNNILFYSKSTSFSLFQISPISKFTWHVNLPILFKWVR